MRKLLAAVLAAMLALPALAQDLGRDPDAPIEIEADNLEVRQDDNLAIFTGNVDAVQGRMTLTTDELRVTYRTDGKGGGGADVGGAISKLEAVGNVVINTAAERATGRRGVYDVDAGIMRLEGGVQLFRDDNVLTGQTLVMNLNSGVSTLDAGNTGRVKGVFRPEQKTN
ncbi:MAG: LptA/OstA family protein [Minwuia sp.]|uniref:LptA/OstA family protein n=1 Tax=Minwuia sp. TaxID=2493630 RepID=UPI003A8AFCCD